ncbi:hypothetical protein BHM03_00009939 [Ensete ventricosum]|nr:hypothetical protein BHM03_00009939 [Ensete ventricosum]
MEAVNLLCSVASTTIISSLLSLALAIQSIPLFFRRLWSPAPEARGRECDGGGDAAVRLYEGRVHHARRRPVAHAFEYPARYALIDLDRAPQPSHLSADRAREIARTNGSTSCCFVGFQVTNTPWGERVSFVFCPGSDVVAKPLHVSPFMVRFPFHDQNYNL